MKKIVFLTLSRIILNKNCFQKSTKPYFGLISLKKRFSTALKTIMKNLKDDFYINSQKH